MKELTRKDWPNELLLESMANGDAASASEFHRRYAKRLFQLVRRLMGPDAEIEDVVQTVFVNFFNSMSRIKDPGRLDFFVDGVAFRTVYRELRRRKKYRKEHVETDFVEQVVDNRNPHATLFARQFYKALATLQQEEQMVIILKYFEHRTLQEISNISGWSVATVKRRVNNAQVELARIAKNDDILTECIGEKHNVG